MICQLADASRQEADASFGDGLSSHVIKALGDIHLGEDDERKA